MTRIPKLAIKLDAGKDKKERLSKSDIFEVQIGGYDEGGFVRGIPRTNCDEGKVAFRL